MGHMNGERSSIMSHRQSNRSNEDDCLMMTKMRGERSSVVGNLPGEQNSIFGYMREDFFRSKEDTFSTMSHMRSDRSKEDTFSTMSHMRSDRSKEDNFSMMGHLTSERSEFSTFSHMPSTSSH